MANWSKSTGNLSFQPLKTFYLYHNVYDQHTWQGIYHERLTIHWLTMRGVKSHDLLITWSYKFAWETKTLISPLPKCLWSPNLVGWELILKSSYPYSYLILWSRGFHDRMTNWSNYISTTRLLRPLKLTEYDTLIAWSFKTTWQTKIIISFLPHSLWTLNFGGCWRTLRGFYT